MSEDSGADGRSSSVRALAVKILTEAEKKNRYSDRLLGDILRKEDLPRHRRNFLTELVKGVSRMKGLLDFYLSEIYKGDYKSTEYYIRNLLRVGTYQMMYINSVPDYAALNESVELARTYRDDRTAGLVNGILRNFRRKKEMLDKRISELPDAQRLATNYSHPEWMVERWIKRFGSEQTEEFCRLNNSPPLLTVRLNPLLEEHPSFEKTRTDKSLKITESTHLKGYFTIEGGLDTSSWDALSSGEVTVQDTSAGLAVRLLDPQPGMTVVDLCSAPGGKTGAIGEAMRDEGVVIAVDRDEWRLGKVEEQAKRLHLHCVKVEHGDGVKIKTPAADAVLVDVPCSGTGVLSKRSDLRWKRKKEDIVELVELQSALLKNAAELVKSGGVLVYSTCTVEEEENWGVVDGFLDENPEFRVVRADQYIDTELLDEKGAVATFPFKHYIDGSFCVRIIRD